MGFLDELKKLTKPYADEDEEDYDDYDDEPVEEEEPAPAPRPPAAAPRLRSRLTPAEPVWIPAVGREAAL